ncbi:DUF6361 family protein [Bacillus marasmi]|uniref:DUF6361 family protein n=1 Tax=Bacillus marasmi TaxID=1926279 RepID=UPI0011CB8F95|nr:DUF6361 family protein [Bacillus marasmi]
MNGLQFGWIDFSKEQRNKVLSVINLLTEPGAVDELGIGVVRDAFANIFFPGTSTIQTRAKYFLIVPYLFTELESEKALNPDKMLKLLHERELELIDVLKQSNEWGIIGENAGRSLQRKPSDIYWNGLRTFGIFTDESMTMNEYVRAFHFLKEKKKTTRSHGFIHQNNSDQDGDDNNAVSEELAKGFWRVPEHSKDWRDTLNIKLSSDEALFLKYRIIQSVPNSLLAWVLENNVTDFCSYGTFEQLEAMLEQFPEQIRSDYQMAKSFAEFIYGAHLRYNVILSNHEDDGVLQKWEEWHEKMEPYSSLDLQEIVVKRLHINNPKLLPFLVKLQLAMQADHIDKLDELILQREKSLKGRKRSKLYNRHEFTYEGWVGIDKLQFRLRQAKNILGDIFEGLGETYVKTK